MRFDFLHHHLDHRSLSRRDALGLGGKAGAAAALGSLGLGSLASAAGAAELTEAEEAEVAAAVGRSHLPPEPIDDTMFDADAVIAGAWAPGPYGPGDQRGSFNEVTAARTGHALRLLDQTKPVTTYNLGETMRNGFPAYPSVPPRIYEQRLSQSGYLPPTDFAGFRGDPVPAGPNQISGHEERFPEGGTYQIATQIDNLNHVGVGPMFYNGFTGPEIARTWGTTALGNEHMGPLITRGVIIDVLGLKQAEGATDSYFTLDGHAMLNDDYRITVEDITAALRRQRKPHRLKSGDVVLLRTGWNRMAAIDPDRYLTGEPGIYLPEARYLAQFRPAIIGGDIAALETLNPDITQGNVVPVHQLLFLRHGIRIGEGMVTDALVRDHLYNFVFIITPQMAKGATAGNTPPAGLAQPRMAKPTEGPLPDDDGVPQPQR